MADDTTHTTTGPNTGTHTTTTTTSSGGSGMAFVLGGIVVLLGILAWLFFGGDVETPSDDGTNATVNIEAAPAADDEVAPVTDGGDDAAAPATDSGEETAPAVEGDAEATTAN